MLEQLHGGNEFGHFGINKTVQAVKRYAYWSGWKGDVERYVRRCTVCCRYRRGPRTKQGPLQPAPSSGPFRKIHLDLTGPHKKSTHGYVYLMTAICSFTKYLIVAPLRDKTALSVAKAVVKNIFLVHGSCDLLVTDLGTEFQNEIMENHCQDFGDSASPNDFLSSILEWSDRKSPRDNQRGICEGGE